MVHHLMVHHYIYSAPFNGALIVGSSERDRGPLLASPVHVEAVPVVVARVRGVHGGRAPLRGCRAHQRDAHSHLVHLGSPSLEKVPLEEDAW